MDVAIVLFFLENIGLFVVFSQAVNHKLKYLEESDPAEQGMVVIVHII